MKAVRRFIAKNHTLGFGKYANKTLGEVIATDPEYIKWCQKNLKHIRFATGSVKKLNKLLKLKQYEEDNMLVNWA